MFKVIAVCNRNLENGNINSLTGHAATEVGWHAILIQFVMTPHTNLYANMRKMNKIIKLDTKNEKIRFYELVIPRVKFYI